MITKVMDMTDPKQVEEVLTGYYNLYSADLQCVEQRTTPDIAHLTDPRVIVVAAYDDGEIAGITMVDEDWVVFPVLSGDYVECLKALILAAYEANGGFLKAHTSNQLILETAVAMGIGVIRDGNDLVFN